MNSQIRNLAVIAFAAALPLGLAAQSGTTGGSSTGTGTSGTGSDVRSGSSQSGSMQSGSNQGSSTRGSSSGASSTASGTQGTSTGSDYSSTSGSSGLRGISRVDQDGLKQQFTATDLIGKDVYDNGGKKVGEVKDVVLGSAAGSHLAMAFAGGESDSGSTSGTSASGRTTTGSTSGATTGTSRTSSTGSSYGGVSGAGSAGDANRTAGTTGTGRTSTSGTAGTSGTTGTGGTGAAGSLGSDISSAFDTMSGMASEPAAIVSLGGFMGMGDNLVRVPLSQLNYDASNERLTLAVSENEISSLTDQTSGRQAAE